MTNYRLEAKRLAGIPESVVLYCARHRFATDAMQATGNIMAVMDAMGHERVDTLRIYSHPELAQIREAMNKRNGQCSKLPQSSENRIGRLGAKCNGISW